LIINQILTFSDRFVNRRIDLTPGAILPRLGGLLPPIGVFFMTTKPDRPNCAATRFATIADMSSSAL
jgi:hypothetical protein